MMNLAEEKDPKTLYVGNLDVQVSEELLCTLFAQIGPIKGCKIIRESGNDPYAFVEFTNHQAASTALAAMNGRKFLDKEIKVNWATSPGYQNKTDTSSHHHIFVGDLSPEIDMDALRNAFMPFGEISNCRIVRDPQTLKSKGYAFVSFVRKADAEAAIQGMNGQWLGSRSIRTNWSTRKPPPPRAATKQSNVKGSSYEEVYNQTSPTNTTVYCGGFGNIADDTLENTFMRFGRILDIRTFRDKGYAFIRFATKESAARAIEEMNNGEINGATVKCYWGKEQPDSVAAAAAAIPAQQPQQQPQAVAAVATGGYQYPATYATDVGVGYWYPNTYQSQSQYMQTYAYSQYAQYPQNYRMVPGAWPASAAAAAAGQAAVAAGQAAAGQAAAVAGQPMVTYTMPQFQTQ